MRKLLLGIVITVALLFIFRFLENKRNDRIEINENSALIEQEIKAVGKLAVSEGHFSEVFTYKNSDNFFGTFLTLNKKALVVVNAKVTVLYDLSKLNFSIDRENKTLKIVTIPEEEVAIHPDIEYYDIQAGFFNPFEAKDHNSIKDSIVKILAKKIDQSAIKNNAKGRLISELAKFYVLTNSLGWTLTYQEQTIDNPSILDTLKF